jgi:hypothetical protein
MGMFFCLLRRNLLLWFYMKKILSFFKPKKNTPDLRAITEKQLSRNIEVIKSLRDYDEGKKDISTNIIQKHLPRVRVTSR